MRSFTERLRQVLELAALGYSNRAIGQELGIKPATVEQHLITIRGLLGASSKREAVEFATRAGLLR